MRKLSKSQITRLNKITISENGGQFIPPDNFLHGEQLGYLVEMIDAELFGEPLYPSISDKAALYMFNVISNHIFSDGNKRTGLSAALVFLNINGYELSETLYTPNWVGVLINVASFDKHLEEFTLAVASGKVGLDQCREWFGINAIPKSPKDNGPSYAMAS